MTRVKLTFDTQRMHNDILKRLNEIDKPQRYLREKVGLSKSTFHRMLIGKHITMNTFLVLLQWLETDPGRYIRKI